MAPHLTTEDDLKMLYIYINLCPGKARMADVAQTMGLNTSTAQYRFSALMKRLEKDHGSLDGAGVTLSQMASPVSKQTPKRKRAKKDDAKKAVKKTRNDEDNNDSDNNNDNDAGDAAKEQVEVG